ncbi:ABC transporter substrate-binding protein [Halospeciosus flavus]|uniref:ABC transporter substrate-binding protein n=1 Tax=Halospeciosus flavus TaxID=3032283 RepID=A0ABD5Z0G0_9EURY|nr:ABC transporter substrate-binding protein [Halospeciosus flavus]
MADKQTTRRAFLGGGAALGTSLLAGCTGGNGSTSQTTTTKDSSYSVQMAPVGEVTFDEVPQTWVANNGSWADMGVALGVEPPKGLWLTSRYHTQYYDPIPDVSVDKSGMTSLYSSGGVSKEVFYQLNGDVHVIDPHFLNNRFKGWEQKDIEEVADKIGPFFGNSIFSRGYAWHDSYQFYTLYEAFEKLSNVFQRQDRYEAFTSVHDEMQQKLAANLPPESERPNVAIFWASGDAPETFLPYLINEGTSYKQWRDLQVGDALAETDVQDFHASRSSIDYETLLEIDPEVILLRGQESKTAEEFQNTVVEFMKNHDVASDLTAVKNGDVYRAGGLYQGPITNLVLTERAVGQIYPDAFDGVSLYDPQRVSDIANGNF